MADVTKAHPEEMKALYESKTGNRYGDFIDLTKQYTLRIWDGMDGCWTDCMTDSAEKVLAEWWVKTEMGTKNTSFDNIDYYRIFPADGTKMLFSGRNEMFRQPEHPDPEIAAEVQADAELAEKVDALVARVSELEAENERLKTPTKGVRPEVAAFSQQMEKRLAEFDEAKGPRSWKDADARNALFILRRAYEKMGDLERDWSRYENTKLQPTPRGLGAERAAILSSACDVANYAMMLVDICSALPLAQPTQTDISNLRMREALKAAKAHITDALGTQHDDEIEAHIKEIDGVLEGTGTP